MELYMIHHGQSTNNALSDPRSRVCDPPLTELGRRQAEIVAQHLATGTRPVPWEENFRNRSGCGITRLYCSPMWRALQTAQYIGQTLGLAPQVWIDIHYHHLNTAISWISFRGDGHLDIEFLNRVDHLPIELLS
jgi:broad specificity phosphatase PhoE